MKSPSKGVKVAVAKLRIAGVESAPPKSRLPVAIGALVIAVTLIISIAFVAWQLWEHGQSGETGKLVILVKDDPVDDFTQVWVTFSEVKVHRANAGNDSGWHTITLIEQTIDLKALSGTNMSTTLGIDTIPAGKYTQIRIQVQYASGIDNQSNNISLTLTNGQIFLIHPFEVQPGGTTTILVDFDLAQSIKLTGNKEYKFTPVAGVVSQ